MAHDALLSLLLMVVGVSRLRCGKSGLNSWFGARKLGCNKTAPERFRASFQAAGPWLWNDPGLCPIAV